MKHFLALVMFLTACGGGPVPSTPSDDFTVIGTLSEADKALVREQIAKANNIAQKHGYAPIPANQIRVEIMQHDARCENPGSFMVEQQVPIGSNPYDNDRLYDHDDRLGWLRICAGGRFIEPNKIQATVEGIRAGYGVHYELEHMILYLRDRQRYTETMYHTPETAHPILQ